MPQLDMETQATPAQHSKDMPYVRFETQTIEDPVRTKETGTMCYLDQDYAIITTPGGKTTNIEKVKSFFLKMEEEERIGRIHPQWLATWKRAYELYKDGQELPVNGTPIKGWKLLTGAQQKQLLELNVRSVEELANLSDEGMRHFGMGAVEVKRRAQSWISQNAGLESATIKMTELQRENDLLKGQLTSLQEKVDLLAKQADKKK